MILFLGCVLGLVTGLATGFLNTVGFTGLTPIEAIRFFSAPSLPFAS